MCESEVEEMKKYQEVEVKYELFNKDIVNNNLESLHLEHTVIDERQKDTYYMPCHRNFLEHEIVSEWLRIRETDSKCSINFKQWLPIGVKIQNQCNEYETILSDPEAMHQILKKLDFREIVIVEKKRNSWIWEQVEISIDEVSGLGSFIELEAMEQIKENEIIRQQKKFEEIIKELQADVGPRDRRGYPYQLLDRKGALQ